jgi:hypothetical protein
MNDLALWTSSGAVALGIGVTRLSVAKSRHRRGNEATDPPSLVRVLRTEDELHEAVDRALSFERIAAQSVRERIDRYSQARGGGSVVPLPIGSDARAAVPPAPTAGPTALVGERDSA